MTINLNLNCKDAGSLEPAPTWMGLRMDSCSIGTQAVELVVPLYPEKATLVYQIEITLILILYLALSCINAFA